MVSLLGLILSPSSLREHFVFKRKLFSSLLATFLPLLYPFSTAFSTSKPWESQVESRERMLSRPVRVTGLIVRRRRRRRVGEKWEKTKKGGKRERFWSWDSWGFETKKGESDGDVVLLLTRKEVNRIELLNNGGNMKVSNCWRSLLCITQIFKDKDISSVNAINYHLDLCSWLSQQTQFWSLYCMNFPFLYLLSSDL